MKEEKPWRDMMQDLRDAGCDDETVEQFGDLGTRGNTQGQLELLSRHRKQLLEKIHHREQQICCLDYLTYQLEKGEAWHGNHSK